LLDRRLEGGRGNLEGIYSTFKNERMTKKEKTAISICEWTGTFEARIIERISKPNFQWEGGGDLRDELQKMAKFRKEDKYGRK